MAFASLCSTLSMPFILALASCFSLRIIMTAGALLGGIGYICMGMATDVRLFAALFAVVMVVAQGCGGVIANLLTQRWFIRFRGRAFGVVNVGTSLSGAVLPFAVLLLVDAFGVTAGYAIMGGIVLALAPVLFFMVRDYPSDLGLTPDGEAPQSGVLNCLSPEQACGTKDTTISISLRAMFSDPVTWIVGMCFGFGLFATSGVSSQLKPRLADTGLSHYAAMACMCLTGLFAAVGKYMWGWMCDKTSPLVAARMLFTADALFLGFIFLPPGYLSTTLFIVLYGSSMGACGQCSPRSLPMPGGGSVLLPPTST